MPRQPDLSGRADVTRDGLRTLPTTAGAETEFASSMSSAPASRGQGRRKRGQQGGSELVGCKGPVAYYVEGLALQYSCAVKHVTEGGRWQRGAG